jgi:hypothetical protein
MAMDTVEKFLDIPLDYYQQRCKLVNRKLFPLFSPIIAMKINYISSKKKQKN